MVLFPADSLKRFEVERDYAPELVAARNAGLQTALLDFDGLRRGDHLDSILRRVQQSEASQTLLYRGWMLRAHEYARLFDGLQKRGWNLINDPQTYGFAHHLPENYELWRARMPETVWLEREHFEREGDIDFAPIFEILRPFGSSAVVLKDWVKSCKHDWLGACFIPDASDQSEVRRVVNRFLELTGEGLTGGLVFRRFENLRPGEWRSFWLDGELLSLSPNPNGDEKPDLAPFFERVKTCPSRFFSLDLAQKSSGEWLVIEMGDGGVSGLAAGEDVEEWYRKLKQRQPT